MPLLTFALSATASLVRSQTPIDSSFLSMVPAAFPVGFDLMTEGKRQYAAYYDSAHNMTVAMRNPGVSPWIKQVLPSKVGWDSHNYLTMALDGKGHLHVSGNMHAVPLIYFRTSSPYDITTLKRVPNLVSTTRETSVTYPEFVKGPLGDLYFLYRQGLSGDGLWYLDKFNDLAESWSALYGGAALFGNLDRAGASVNAYFTGPQMGPDGRFHIFFMWRDNGDASTCHDAGYIRTVSNNLDAWESVDGKPLTLPITLNSPATTFDSVAIKQGLINMGFSIGFDSRNRAILSYHKYDTAGISQIYNARYDSTAKRWQVVKASPWKNYRWEFGGGGTIASEIAVGPVTLKQGKLTETWRHSQFGSGEWILDEKTLLPVDSTKLLLKIAASETQHAVAEDLIQKSQWDRGMGDDPYVRYRMRWQTQGPNRDVQPDTIPPDSRLEVVAYRFTEPQALFPVPSDRRSRYPDEMNRVMRRWFPYQGEMFDLRGRQSAGIFRKN